MANENRWKLYTAINKAGYDIGSYDDFDKRMNNADDRQKFFTAVNDAGYDIGSQEVFERRISPSKYKLKTGGKYIPVSEREYKDFARRNGAYGINRTNSQNIANGANGSDGVRGGRSPMQFPAGFGELDPESSVAPFMREEAKRRREASYGTPEQRDRVEKTFRALRGDRKAAKEVGTERMSQQLRDRADYYKATGKELKHAIDNAASADATEKGFDLSALGFAPTVARDNQGNIIYGEDGNPLRGMAGDDVRAGTQLVEQERIYRESWQRQVDEANAELERLNEQMSRIAPEWVDQDGRIHYGGGRSGDEEAAALQVAYNATRERLQALQQEKEGGRHGFFSGLMDAAKDPSTWMLGLNKIGDNVTMYRVSEKVKKKEALTEGEQAMLDATIANNQIQQRLEDGSDWLYRAGRMTTEMLPFMGQIMLTGGYGSVAAIGERMGQKWATAYAQRFGEKALMNRININLLRGFGIGMGDIAAGFASANTTGAVNTINDAIQRKIGQLGYDEDGDYVFTDDEDWLSAVMKAEVSQTKEFATERFGEHLPGLRRLNVMLAKQGPRARAVSRALSGLAGTKAMQKTAQWLRKGGVNGIFGEVLEEEIGLPVDVAIGDMTWEEALSGKTQWDIVGGMLLSVGAMHSVGLATQGVGKVYNTAQYYRYKRATDNASKIASFKMSSDRWEPLKERIDGTTSETMSALWDEIRNDGSLGDQEKRSAYDYMNALTMMRGYNMGMLFSSREKAIHSELAPEETSPEDEAEMAILAADDEGRTAETADEKKRYVDDAEEAENALDQYGDAFKSWVTSQDPTDVLEFMLEHRDSYTDEEITAAVDYYQKRTRADAVMDAAMESVDMQVSIANAEVRANTHEQTGNVVMAKGADDLDFYVIGGDIVEEDGVVSLSGTGGAVVVKNAQTGEVSVKSPQELSVYSMENADALIQRNEKELRDRLLKEADDDVTYGSPANEVYEKDDVVTLSDGQGGVINGEIGMLPNSADGVYVVYTDDIKEPVKRLTADELNRRIVTLNGQEVQRATGHASASEIQQPEAEATQPEQQGVNTQTAENYAQNVGENIPEQGNNVGENIPTGSESVSEESPSALSKIPVRMDVDGKPMTNRKGRVILDWHKASVDDATDAIIEKVGGDMLMARDTASDMVRNSQSQLEKIRKQKPKGEDALEIAESRMEMRRMEQEQQQIIKQWQDVVTSIRKRMEAEETARRAAAEAAKSAEQKAREAEEARIRQEQQDRLDRERIEQSIQRDRERRNRPYEPLQKAREEMRDDPEAMMILDDTEPRDLEEWVSSMLRPHLMLWQDASESERGLQSELGLRRGDMQRFMYLLGTKESGAKSFDRAVQDIYGGLSEGLKNQYRDQDVRNVLLELFRGSENSREMMNLAAENRITEARTVYRENLRREAEAEMEAWAEAYHLNPDERDAWEEYMQQPPTPIENDVINQLFADYEQNRRSEEMDQQPDSTGGAEGIEGSEVQVQETAEAADYGNPAEGTGQGAETGTGEPAPAGDNVAGGELGGAIPKPEVDKPRIDAIRNALTEAYRRNETASVMSAATELQAYVDEGLDDYVESDPEIVDYEGDDPKMLSEQYITRVFLDRYLDEDEDQEYIRTGIKQSEQLKPVDLRDATRVESPEIGVSEANAKALYQLSATEKDADGNSFYENNGSIDLWSLPELFAKAGRQSAPIRLTDRNLQHILDEHRKEIGNEQDVFDFLDDIFNNAPVLRRARGRGMFVVVEQDKTDKAAIIKLMPSDTGDYYNVETAGYYRKNKWKDYEDVIADLREPDQSDAATDVSKPQIPNENGREPINAETQASSSHGKDTNNSANLQENQGKSAPIGATSSPEQIAQEEGKVDTNPTDGQKEAGNYQKGHIKVDGYDITIENPKGSVRSGVDSKGNRWKTSMNNTYGYIRGTEGVDGDHIDVFLSDNPASGNVYVIDQVDDHGTFDEHKVMYGFGSEEEARQAYLSNYSKGWKGVGTITEVTRDEFKKWVESSHRKTKPFAEYKSVKKATAEPQPTEQPTAQQKRLVSDDRMEELRKRLRQKLGGQLNVGVDPEVLAIGAEMAVGYIERGVTSFADYAKTMIEEVGDFMRPYLKSFYNAVRDMPEAQEYAGEMDDYQTVSSFDVFNFDKQKQPTAMEKAQQVVQERKVRQQARQIEDEKKRAAEAKKAWENLVNPKEISNFADDKWKQAAWVDEHLDEIADAYINANGNKLDPDEFRRCFAAIGYDGKNVPDFREQEKRCVAEIYSRMLRRAVENGNTSITLLTGVGGAGKSTATRNMDLSSRGVVFDGAFNGFSSLKGAIEIAKQAGMTDIQVIAVHNDALTAFGNTVKRGLKTGRFLSIQYFDKGAFRKNQDKIAKLRESYPEVELICYDNSGNKGSERANGGQVPVDEATKWDYTIDYRLLNQLLDILEDGINEGRFTKDQAASIGRDVRQIEGRGTEDERRSLEARLARIERRIRELDDEILRPALRTGDGRERMGNHLGERMVSSSDGEVQGLSGSSSTEGASLGTDRGMAQETPGQLDLFGNPILNNQRKERKGKDNGLQRTNEQRPGGLPSGGIRPEPGNQGQSGTNSQEIRQGGDRADGGREGGSLRQSADQRLESAIDNNVALTQQQTQQPAKTRQEPDKNNRNNQGKRGEDYAPTSPKARFNANVEAIRLLRELTDQGVEVPTKEQMAVLRQYSGWGGLGTFFNDESSAENRILRDLLSEEEYNDAALSINSAYYTPAMVIDSLWDIAKAMGFEGGSVLEGSAGIGNIIGQMPREVSRRSDIEAVEIDSISGNILRLLYPDAKVHIRGFQDTMVRNGSVDLAITNVPFVTGLHVIDKVDKDLSRKFTNIHDFCIAKNIRKLREGGIGLFITSSGTLDKSTKLRAWITDEGQADVVGAFRLNNKTFGGTKVTSDIIVVRKRVNGRKSPHAIDISKASPHRVGTWTDNGVDHQASMTVNDYFRDHPEMMAGEMAFGFEKGDTFRPGSYGLYPVAGKDQEKMLKDFAKEMAKAKEVAVAQQQTEQVQNQLTAEKEGAMLVDDKGRLCVSRYGIAQPLNLNDQKVKGYTRQQCFADYQAVQKAVEDVLQQELGDPDDTALKPKLDALNKAYDKFVKRYGTLHKNTSISFLRNDIDFPSFQALEDYKEVEDIPGKKTVRVNKTKLFTERVLGFRTEPQPKTVKDAVIASMFRNNGIDVAWIAGKLGKDIGDVRHEILDSRLGFEDPSTGQLEIRYKYLSGNVREKLAIAEGYNTDGKYAANVEELRKAVPMDIPAHLIDFSLGSSWIPIELYKEYLKEIYDLDNAKLTHVEGSWVLNEGYSFRNEKNRSAGVYSEKFRETIYGHQLVAAALNNRPVKVAKQVSEGYGSSKKTRTKVDQAATQACAVRVDEIKDDFKQWAKKKMQEDPDLASRIEKTYNDKFNAIVPIEIDDEFMPDKYEGANVTISLYGHQKRGVMRGLTSPTMLAHEVGTGKSFTLITTAMEMRRLGTAKKPMVVVQNATVAQITSDAKLLYPNAKVLSLSEQDRSAEGRRAFYAKIKYNDWDLVIVPQSTFERIPDSPERELQFIQEKIDEKKHVIEAAEASGMDSREIQRLKRELSKIEEEYGDTALDNDIANIGSFKKKKKDAKREAASLDKAETRAKEMLDRAVDDVQYFDDLGVDALLVDEAHEYKHLGFQTSIGRGIKGIDPSYSKKCAGLYNKTRSVFEKSGWKNVVFATGTPISNTAAEIWTFMKYLMPSDVMRQNDIYYFDDFVHNFGSISQMLEFTTSGKFKENTRFAAYVNKPELIRIWSQVAHTVLTKETNVMEKVPEKEGGKDQDVFLPQSPSLISIMSAVRSELERYEKMDGKEKKENSHIPLTMYGIAKRAAIDPRLVNPDAPDEPLSKTNAAVKEIVKDLKATDGYKGTVAVFCDNQNRKGSDGSIEFNIYDDMKTKLISQGVPENQIAIIRSGMSITAKQKVFDAANSGAIRVVLGSTQTLGTGVNIQERLHLLIHMDAPDRPMDYTQRNGRIVRQGNLHKKWGKSVRIVRFGVEDSLDVTAYQRLKTKSSFIDSIMDGKESLLNNQVDRTVEEEEEGLFDNPVAVLSGSQYALKKNQAERELRKYQGKKAQHEADQIYVANALRSNKGKMAANEGLIREEKDHQEHIRSLFPDGKVKSITIDGVTVAASNGEQLARVMKEKVNDPVNAIVKRNRENAFYNDEVIPVKIELDGHAVNFEVSVERESVYDNGRMRTVIHKYTTYNSPDLREERTMKSSSSVRDHLDEILDEVVTGRDYQDRIEALEQSNERMAHENEQLEQRVGMDFPYVKELAEAEKRVDDYTELMKQEMAEKEAKYAKQQAAAVDLSKADSEDDEDLYRAADRFSEGETFPIHVTYQRSSYNVLGDRRSYSTDLMPDEYATTQALLDAVRNQYPEYHATIEDGNVRMESWEHILRGAALAQQHTRQKGTRNYVERKTRNAVRAVEDMARRMNLDVEVLTSTDGLKGEKARAKGFFTRKTGKISIVLPNHVNQSDVMNTLLHEGVAHYGLRKLFGDHFDTFLDNIYNNVSPEVKARIDAAMKRNKWSQHVATEEYLARLAERTDFEHATEQGWWHKIKRFFIEMLGKAGFDMELTDNDLRYVLWRSYDNLLHPDGRRTIFETAKEVEMRRRLGIRRERERARLQRTGRVDTSWLAADRVGEADVTPRLREADIEEVNRVFNEELQRQIDGTLERGHVYDMGMPSAYLRSTEIPNLPIRLQSSVLSRKTSDPLHRYKLEEVRDLVQLMQKPIAIFSYGDKEKAQNLMVGIAQDVEDGKQFLVGLSLNPSVNGKELEINSVRNVFPKNFHDWIHWINQGKMLRMDGKKEIEAIIDALRINPVDYISKDDLDSAAKIVENFENPKLPDENLSDEDELLFRSDDDWEDTAKQTYEEAVAKKSLKIAEAWQDSMVSLKALQDAIEKETGNKATGVEDAYRFENRMHGRAKNMSEQYDWQFYRPMLKAFSDFIKAKGMTQEEGMDYLISKSGLERNVYYAMRDGFKEKVTDEIKERRDALEKEYSKGKMSEADYKKKKADIDEDERTGVDDKIKAFRELLAYKRSKEDYDNGKISYTVYQRRVESLLRSQLKRTTPKKDKDGNVVSDNYYDDYVKDYSGLTETLAKEKYDEAQRLYKQYDKTIDKKEKASLWKAYSQKMKEAFIDARAAAEKLVEEVEDAGDEKNGANGTNGANKTNKDVGFDVVRDLWYRINAATKETLRHSFEMGLIDKKNYQKVREMFDYYIPLRGWDEDKASDVYTYMGKDNVFSPAVKKTRGRTSKAEHPLAYIGNIAVSTILSGHRNQMKQHFLNYVLNNPTSLVSISESWYEKIGDVYGKPLWVLRTADTAGKSGDEIAHIIAEFNEEMRLKQKEGKAMPVKGRLRLDVNATKGQKAEHVVEVQRAGRTYQIYINGDPKAAQALNGTHVKAVSRISDTDVGKKLNELNHSMAAYFTSKNPAFVISNLSRDLNMARASIAIKENKEYNKRFVKNVGRVLTPRMGESSKWVPASKQPTGMMPSLLRKWKNGTLDMADETERLFKEFMDEGGETGFVNMLSIDSFKEKMQKEIQQMNGSSLLGSKDDAKETTAHKGLRLMGETFEFYNRCAEDATRFIVYMTSRQMGKTLEESIADAKDVTLNFNRKGTGGMWNAVVRDLFIFVNPAIQALSNMYKMMRQKPLKFGVVTGSFIIGGMMMPIINQGLLILFGDDDDKEAYWNLPPWVRKNNLVCWVPFTKNFVTIPLAQEFRVFYGIGEMVMSGLMDHHVNNMGLEIISSVADLIPINPTGNGGNMLVNFMPTGVQPLVQIGVNVDFTGRPLWKENQGNKYDPMYTKAYVSTPQWMVKVSKAVNDITGGNEGRRGWIERNLFWGNYVNNPAVWNHLLQGYFGGMYNTVAKTADVLVTAFSGEKPKMYQVPVLNRFLNRPVERDTGGVLGEDYYALRAERDEVSNELRKLRQGVENGSKDAKKALDDLLGSARYKRALVIGHYVTIMKDLQGGERAIKEGAAQDKDLFDVQDQMQFYKTAMMEDLQAIEDDMDPLDAAKVRYEHAENTGERVRLKKHIEQLMKEKLGDGQKAVNSDVEKALQYVRDDEKESSKGERLYLDLATSEDILNDARVKALRSRVSAHRKEYKRLMDEGKQEEALRYRGKNAHIFEADARIQEQSRIMKKNMNLLGKGSDDAIMQLIGNNRNEMLRAAEMIEGSDDGMTK